MSLLESWKPYGSQSCITLAEKCFYTRELCLEGRFCSYCLAQQNLTDFSTLLYLHRFVLTSACISCVLQICTFNIKICPVNLGEKYVLFLKKKYFSFSQYKKGQIIVSIQMVFVLLLLHQFLSNPEKFSTVSAKSVLQRIFFPLLHHMDYVLITSWSMLLFRNNAIVTLCSMITVVFIKV